MADKKKTLKAKSRSTKIDKLLGQRKDALDQLLKAKMKLADLDRQLLKAGAHRMIDYDLLASW